VEYLKAIAASGARLCPVTIKREGAAHDSESGRSASALRKILLRGEIPEGDVPDTALSVYLEEIAAGRGPVSMKACEPAILSRLRLTGDFSHLPAVSEGLDRRFMRYAASEPTIGRLLDKMKTKRYAMSRLRRLLMCACLGITAAVTSEPPPYIRVLAMNHTGANMLRAAGKTNRLPIIIKPAAALSLPAPAADMFRLEAAATDLYVLAYRNEDSRAGGQEWRRSPIVVD